jgi:hypothetical protein
LAHVPETASRSSQRRLRRQGIPADQPCVHGTDMGALCRVRCRSIGIIARRRTLDRVFDERISFCVEKMGGHRLPSESARLRPAAGKRFPYPADGECSWHVTFRERVGAGRHLARSATALRSSHRGDRGGGERRLLRRRQPTQRAIELRREARVGRVVRDRLNWQRDTRGSAPRSRRESLV